MLPAGRWRYWFDDSKVIEGPAVLSREYPLGEFPVYIREGAIIPMNITRDYTGIGEFDWNSCLTFNIYPGKDSSIKVPLTDKSGTLNVSVHAGNPTTVKLDGTPTPHILRIYSDNKPVSVDRDGELRTKGIDWQYNAESHRLIIKTDWPSIGTYKVKY